MKCSIWMALAAGSVLAAGANAQDAGGDHSHHGHHGSHETHAPAGVMGEHIHPVGEWMVSYRYMPMSMDGNRSGTDSVSPEEVLAAYPVTPLKMTMDMHMFGVMYAPLDKLTLMGMVNVLDQSMDHRVRNGVEFTTETSGLSDASLSGFYALHSWGVHSVHANFGLSFPTGSIDEMGDTPAGNIRLPYPMQLGSGTFDFLPGFTYVGQNQHWSWGGQATGTVRMGDNDEGYTLGDRFEGTFWSARTLSDWLSVSGRMDTHVWGNVDGADPNLNPMMVPTADPSLRGGTRMDVGVGANVNGSSGALAGHRFAFEALFPIYQDLDGPQLETDFTFVAGWQVTIGS